MAAEVQLWQQKLSPNRLGSNPRVFPNKHNHRCQVLLLVARSDTKTVDWKKLLVSSGHGMPMSVAIQIWYGNPNSLLRRDKHSMLSIAGNNTVSTTLYS